MTRLWDISPPLHAGTPVYPGDSPYRQRWISRIGPDSVVNVGELTLTSHLGAHADAPLHYDPEGVAVGMLPLEPFIGLCRVVHAIACGPLVRWEHLAHALDDEVLPPRILVRTCERMPLDRWNPDLTALAPEVLETLAERGVQLIGIDTASIDPADSHDLPCHQVLRRHGLRVLENLLLDQVPEGDYELIALPLKLTTADASPVRAVLRSLA
jgi:arylformamidase